MLASLEAQQIKNLPTVQKTQEIWVQSLGQDDPLEKEMATYSSMLAWNIPWTEEFGGPQSKGLERVGYYKVTKYTHIKNRWFCITQSDVIQKFQISLFFLILHHMS